MASIFGREGWKERASEHNHEELIGGLSKRGGAKIAKQLLWRLLLSSAQLSSMLLWASGKMVTEGASGEPDSNDWGAAMAAASRDVCAKESRSSSLQGSTWLVGRELAHLAPWQFHFLPRALPSLGPERTPHGQSQPGCHLADSQTERPKAPSVEALAAPTVLVASRWLGWRGTGAHMQP